MKSYDNLFIGGQWAAPSTSDTIDVVSPYTEQVIARVPAAAEADVDRAVTAARTTFEESDWPRRPLADRLEVLGRFAAEYGRRFEDLAQVTTEEMGAPIATARANTGGAVVALQAFMSIAQTFPWSDERPGAYGGAVRVSHEPVGVVGAVVPWNAPQFLIVSKLAPALIAGCTVVVKPAPETPIDALMLGEVAEAAGLPEGVLSIVPADRAVSEYLVGHPGVDKIAFTGSTAAGRRIAAIAAEGFKRVSLELGGKSAAIVLDDADIGALVEGVRMLTLSNAGQICSAQSRVVVTESRYEETVQALADLAASLVIGNPADESTEVGPVVAERQRARIREYIALAPDEGARLVTGGPDSPDGFDQGWFVRPTVLADVDNKSRIGQEEIFGPVLTVTRVADEAEAVAVANDSTYGLSGSVWTSDVERGFAVAAQIQTGTIGVNQSVTLDPAAPFGGWKNSGVGVELGPEGLSQYLRYKSILHGLGSLQLAGE